MVAAAWLLLRRLETSGFRWDLLFSTLRSVEPRWLTASISLILLSYVGRVLRWRVMIRGVSRHPNTWNLLSATLVGFTAVVFFGRPGEFVRPYLIARKEGVSVSSQMAAWFIERIYDLLLVLLLFGFALTRVEGRGTLGPNLSLVLRTGGYLAGVLGVICLGILFLSKILAQPLTRLMRRLTRLLPARAGDKIHGMFDAFMKGMSFAGSPAIVTELVLLSVAEWAVIVGGIYCLFQAYPPTAHLTLIENIVFTGFVAFGGAVQVPGIGGGMQVAAVVVLTELYGLALETATGMALFLWAATWLVVVPFGVLLSFREGLKWSSLRHVDQEMSTPAKVIE